MRKWLLSLFVFAAVVSPSAHALTSAAGPGTASSVVAGVVDPYLRIQAKLAADTTDGGAADAGTIIAAAPKLGAAGAPVLESARRLQSASTIEASRTAFLAVTNALFAYADATGSSLGPGVRRTFCPMEKRPWAQKNDEIANPYAGKRMLRCGYFTDKP